MLARLVSVAHSEWFISSISLVHLELLWTKFGRTSLMLL